MEASVPKRLPIGASANRGVDRCRKAVGYRLRWVSPIRGGFVVRAIPSDRPVMTPRWSAGLDARAPTGSTPAGGDVGSANTSRAQLKPPPTHQPDEGIDSVLGNGLRDSPPRAEDRRLTRRPSPAHPCGKRRPANPRSPAGRPGCEKRTPRRSPAVTTMPPTPPMQPWQRHRWLAAVGTKASMSSPFLVRWWRVAADRCQGCRWRGSLRSARLGHP